MELTDSQKAELINTKEELEVFLLNRAVCFSIAQSESRDVLETCLKKLKNCSNEIEKRDVIDIARSVRVTSLAQLKLQKECISFMSNNNNDSEMNDDDSLQRVQRWRKLLRDLRTEPRNSIMYASFCDRVMEYELDLVRAGHKNDYRDKIYMEFYRYASNLKCAGNVETSVLKNADNLVFYESLNHTENSLRDKIAKLSFEKPLQQPSNSNSRKKPKIQSFVAIPTVVYSNRRSTPKICPGDGQLILKHECASTEKFMPDKFRTERCTNCHYSFVESQGGRIQKRKVRS